MLVGGWPEAERCAEEQRGAHRKFGLVTRCGFLSHLSFFLRPPKLPGHVLCTRLLMPDILVLFHILDAYDAHAC